MPYSWKISLCIIAISSIFFYLVDCLHILPASYSLVGSIGGVVGTVLTVNNTDGTSKSKADKVRGNEENRATGTLSALRPVITIRNLVICCGICYASVKLKTLQILPQSQAEKAFKGAIGCIISILCVSIHNVLLGIFTSLSSPIPMGPPLTAASHINDSKHHLLLCATGSVATIKLPNIILALSHYKNLSIRILLTASAKEFLQGQSEEQPSLRRIRTLPNVDGIYLDEDEWSQPWTRGASILHIELRRWADLMVIAPLSANGLASISLGLSHNLIYSVVRAWDTTGLIDSSRPGISFPYNSSAEVENSEGEMEKKSIRKKGIIVAPAMNTAMWNHPVTKRHLEVLEGEWGVEGGGWMEVLRPIDKGLACGDKGGGAMREWKEIVGVIEERLVLGKEKQKQGEGEEEGYVAVDMKA